MNEFSRSVISVLRLPGRGWRAGQRRRVLAVLLGAGVLTASGPAQGGFAPPKRTLWADALAPDPSANAMEAPERSEAVDAIMSAPFLRPDEAKDLRIAFGAATSADLDTPARRARWALLCGVLDDPALSDPDAPLLDRADAMVQRGDAVGALALLGAFKPNEPSADVMRAVRIGVQAREMIGDEEGALQAARPALTLLGDIGSASAEGVAEAVNVAAMLTRFVTPGEGRGANVPDHKQLMAILKRSREELDPQHWPTVLAEARLLYEKDNFKQAQETARAALTLNPVCAQAWAMIGRLTVDSFNAPAAEQIANRLEVIAGRDSAGRRRVSPMAAIVRARSLLRLSDPDGAEEALAPALAEFPEHRTLREVAIAAQALRFDPGLTKAALDAYDALGGEAAKATGHQRRAAGYFEAGRALSEARQYAAAAQMLSEAVNRQPDWPQPRIDLGLLYIQSGQDQEALATLERAVALDPFNQRAGNCLLLIKDLLTYERHESAHFVVRAKPGLDSMVGAEMLAGLEENHRAVCAMDGPGLRYEPPFKTMIDMLPDHRAFGVRIVGMPAIHTIAASTGPVIAMEAPREGRNHQGTYDWQRVLRHEYTHTVGLTKTNNRMPHWFTEAQAVYLEQAPRDYPTCQLLARALSTDTLFDFTQINIAFVRPRKPTDRAQGYAQGHWMYAFLVERFGADAPLALMDKYGAGVREEQAYREVLGRSREKFMEEFKVWARGQLVAWGMVEKEGEPGLQELIAKVVEARGGGGGEDGADEPAEITSAEIDGLLAAHPTHAALLELAVDRALDAANGEPTAQMVPLLKRYAAARPVDPMPHKLLARFYLGLPQPGSDAPLGPGNAGALDAIEHLEYLDAREDRLPTYAAQLATLYAQAGDVLKARAKAERSTRIAPYDARYRELAAGMALRVGGGTGAEAEKPDLATARRHIVMLTKLEPDRAIHGQRLRAVEGRMNP